MDDVTKEDAGAIGLVFSGAALALAVFAAAMFSDCRIDERHRCRETGGRVVEAVPPTAAFRCLDPQEQP